VSEHDTRPLIVGLGEAMIRLSPTNKVPLVSAHTLQMHVAGSELNLLIAATALGARGRWLTRLPANELGVLMRRHALSYGIEVVADEEADGRAGLMFFEPGVPPRPSTVLYDRKDSAASHLGESEFDWDHVLEGAHAVHVTGITCALGDGPRAATLALLSAAKSRGVKTSFDMNYRSQLWDTARARDCYRQVLPLVDILFVSPGDLTMLSERDDEVEVLAQEIVQAFEVSTMVIRERHEISVEELEVSVRVVGEADSEAVARGSVVDELGAGDAAAGAFLASMLQGAPHAVGTQRCARAYARMLTIPGDSWHGTLRDLTDGYVVNRKVVR
jgi:2-dehydro-3-deoxygluconokinase